MKKAALYSSSATSRVPPPEPEMLVPDVPRAPLRERLASLFRRRERLALFFGGALLAVVPAFLVWQGQAQTPELQQDEIDAAVLHTLETQSLPSRSAKAAELVRQSVVRVQGFGVPDADKPDDTDAAKDKDAKAPKSSKGASKGTSKGANGGKQPKVATRENPKGGLPKGASPGAPKEPPKSAQKGKGSKPAKEAPKGDDTPNDKDENGKERAVSTGTGVVILENGTILTNLHVVAGSKRLVVTFYDGMESEAEIVGLHPENDLAVIRAKKIPDDLPPATMGASGRLKPGDEVVAVGFPFGIGPSVSAGVVSGIGREFGSPKGRRKLTGLIQFDAAANSGNSGGPLITMDGEVVGIVTAILNPTRAGTFIGIGFAVTIEGAGMTIGIAPF